jgi:tRNA(Ile)-lysidine synthase
VSLRASTANHRSRLEWQFASELFERGETVLVGVSGGADSMVLLELLAQLRGPLELTLHAIHVNYQLRGIESLRDELLVRRRCRALDIFLTIERVPGLYIDDSNLEERARDIRHRVFREAAREVGASSLALGHTLDDQAETVLVRLLRGSGMQGLGAMRARDGLIARPLLETRRAEVRAYAHERGIAYRDDATNSDPSFVRNRVRHLLMPLLAEQFNPNVAQTLSDSARTTSDDDAFLQNLAEVLYRRYVKEKSNAAGRLTAASIATSELLELPKALQRRVVRLIEQALGVSRVGHTRALEAALAKLAKKPVAFTMDLGEGLTLTSSHGIVTLTLQQGSRLPKRTNLVG